MRSVLPILVCFSALSAPVRFELKDAGLRNLLYLVSDAPVEKMIGLTNAIDGWIEVNPQKLRDGFRGSVSADLRALETGSEARNEFVRERVLQASENAVAVLELNRIVNLTSETLKKETVSVVKVDGVFKIRGVSRPVSLFLRLQYLPESEITRMRLPGNLLKVSSTFDVDLGELGVSFADGLSNRFARVIQVALDFIGTDQAGVALTVPLPEGPKPKEPRTNTRPPSTDP